MQINPDVINSPRGTMQGIKKEIECKWKLVRSSQQTAENDPEVKHGRHLGYFIFFIVTREERGAASEAHTAEPVLPGWCHQSKTRIHGAHMQNADTPTCFVLRGRNHVSRTSRWSLTAKVILHNLFLIRHLYILINCLINERLTVCGGFMRS